MKVSDIKVTSAFRRTTPRAYKMDACREYYKQNGRIDKPIIVSRSGYVLDGYIRYLILKENNVEETDVVVAGGKLNAPKVKTYVFGRHQGSDKEYCWVINKNTAGLENLKIGNKALVRSSGCKTIITITRVEYLENPPNTNNKIKGVVKCLDE